MHIVDNTRNPQRRKLRAMIVARTKALFRGVPRRLGRLNQFALHLECVPNFAAELISHTVKTITGSVIVSNRVVLLRALDTTQHRGGIVGVFRALSSQGGAQQDHQTCADWHQVLNMAPRMTKMPGPAVNVCRLEIIWRTTYRRLEFAVDLCRNLRDRGFPTWRST